MRKTASEGGAGTATAARDNLTEAEAQRRAALVHDVRYVIDLDLERGASGYRGALNAWFALPERPDDLFIDFTGERLVSVRLNGRPIDPAFNGHRIGLPRDALVVGENHIAIRYANEYDRSGSGFHHFVDPEDGREYAYSDFEPFKAHRLFPCFDQPDIKATYQLAVTAPRDWVVIGNGPLASTAPADEGRTRRVFARTRPFSTYIAAVIAGEYHAWADVAGEIPLRLLCRQSLVEYLEPDVAEIFELTRQGFDFYEDYFGQPYPFGKYDQVFVPEFNAGAMENVGAVTHGEHMIFRGRSSESQRQTRAEVVLHELAHMWFGNLVTMRWWEDLWLNESFATFASYLALTRATRFRDSWEAFNGKIKAWAYRQDQLVTTHPIACPVPDTDATFLNFDGITYGKGASALKQLMAYIGEDAFREGLRRYFARHRWGNATLADFLGALEEGSEHDLGAWSRAWIQTSGLGALTPRIRTKGGKIAAFEVMQEPAPPPGDDTLRPHRLHVALFTDVGGRADHAEIVPVTVDGALTKVGDMVGKPAPVFVWLDHGDHAFAKIFLDDASLAFAHERLEAITDPLTKLQLWGSLWQMVRDHRLKAAEYAELVATKVPLEDNAEIVESALVRALGATLRYVPDERREPVRAPLVAAAWEQVEERRGNLQLVWLRALINLAAAPEDLDRLSALMDGHEAIEGVEIDQPLRWSIIRRLVGFGRPGALERLEQERERDPSDRGRKSAFEAATAHPDAEAKARAWRQFTEPGDASDDFLKAGMGGFNWTNQHELLAPWVDAFFEAVPRIHAERDPEYTRAFFLRLFPGYRVEPDVLARTEAFAEQVGEPQLRRMSLECADELRRAIGCRRLHAS